MNLTVLNVAYPFAPIRPNTAGGAEQALLTLDRALVRRGHQSIVAACTGSVPVGRLVTVARPRGMIDDEVRGEVHRKFRRVIERALDVWNIDVVHLHGIDFAEYLPPPGVPVLVTLHLPVSWYGADSLPRRRPGTWFVCVSRSQHESCPSAPNLLSYVENGVDADAFAGAERPGRYALTLGRVCPEKGFHFALDAAKSAGVPLIIAGEVFPYRAHLDYFEECIRPRLDGQTCRFLGLVGNDRKRRLLAGARCLLVPSLAPETSSLVAMEALASGTPVVAFPAGALPEIVEDGRTGYIVRDADEMAAAIRKTDRIDRGECRAVARERFSADAMMEGYLRLYREIIADAREKRGGEKGTTHDHHR